MKKIKSDEASGIYCFQGEEDYLAKNTINFLKKELIDESVLEFNSFEKDAADMTYNNLYEEIVRLPFMAKKRVIILYNWTDLSKDLAKNYEEIEKYKDSYILVLMSSPESPRKNLSIVKTLMKYDRLVDFDMVNPGALKNWILKKLQEENKKISEAALRKFIEYLNYSKDSEFNSLYKIENEIKKLASISSESIDESIVDSMVNKSISSNIFNLTDAISQKTRKKAIQELNKLLNNGEEPVKILYMLSRHMINVLKIINYKNQGYKDYDIMRLVGISKFEFNKIFSTLKNFSEDKARYNLEKCMEADYILKTKKNEPNVLLFELVVSLT
ncbi:DNA polymerase III subunit delta [Ezakiella sp.]|uniref:DNA polymerase III subunit delta n=1 Tax=Ezakiella sp. TaxID=1935205 RepID=UPI002A91DA21|nr:DNA polymerase III subunit delta [Ezakiella sp.]